jgi:hypothetical protein
MQHVLRCNVKVLCAALVAAALSCQFAFAAEAAAPAPATGTQAQNALAVPIFPLESLKLGMKGTGYTVIRGTEVKPFNVEILELIPKGGFDGGPLILAKFTGEVVEFSKGIAGGYSGSPVYIGDKLLGAVSMAIPYTDTHIGGITPIQSMLQALPGAEEIDYSGNTVIPPTTGNGKPLDKDGNPLPEQMTYVDDYEMARAYNDSMRTQGLNRVAAVRVKTPVFFSGVSPEVRDIFAPRLGKLLGGNFQLLDHPMGKAGDPGLFLRDKLDTPGLLLGKPQEPPPLVRGDAIAVSLIQGDIEAYAIGTLTYSDKQGRFLCFGHPLLQSGDANFPIGKAYIAWTFQSIERGFKEGVRLNSAGTLTRDQAGGCGGMLWQDADLIPVSVKINDIDLGSSQTLKFKVIRHPDFTPMLVAMGMSQAAVQVLDRQPRGTLKISYHIEGVGLKEPLRRTNYYTDDEDVISGAAMELMPLSSLLETNIYREVKVTKILVLVDVTRNRINASIDDAKFILTEEQQAQAAAAAAAGPPPLPEAPAPAAVPTPPAEDQDGVQQPAQDAPPSPAPENPTQPGATPPGTPPLSMPPNPAAQLPTFKPGDTIRVKVRLQPYRTDAVWREFSVKVPDDFPAGNTMVVVHGGGDLISPSELSGKGRSLFGMGPILDLRAHDLDSVLDQIVSWPLNNELLVTLVRPYDPTQAQELGQSQTSAGPDLEKPNDKVDAKYEMEWVIYNGFMLPVNIASTQPPLPPGQGPPGEQAQQEMPAGTETAPNGQPEGGSPDEESRYEDLPY